MQIVYLLVYFKIQTYIVQIKITFSHKILLFLVSVLFLNFVFLSPPPPNHDQFIVAQPRNATSLTFYTNCVSTISKVSKLLHYYQL